MIFTVFVWAVQYFSNFLPQIVLNNFIIFIQQVQNHSWFHHAGHYFPSFVSVAMIEPSDQKQLLGHNLGHNSRLWFIISGKSRQGLKQLVTSHSWSRAERKLNTLMVLLTPFSASSLYSYTDQDPKLRNYALHSGLCLSMSKQSRQYPIDTPSGQTYQNKF